MPFCLKALELVYQHPTNIYVQIASMANIWIIIDKHWSQQCKAMIKACILNIINTIWFNKNQNSFNDKVLNWRSEVNVVIAKVSLSSKNTLKASHISMDEFRILKACHVNIRLPIAPIIKEVIWYPPICPWIKINTDGASVKKILSKLLHVVFSYLRMATAYVIFYTKSWRRECFIYRA
jgi:hypothetical protein